MKDTAKLVLFLTAIGFSTFLLYEVLELQEQLNELEQDLSFYEYDAVARELTYNMQLEEFNTKLYKKTQQISVLEESIDPKNKRWAKIKLVRKVIQEISAKKGQRHSITELTKIASSVVDSSEVSDVEIPLILAVMTQESAYNPKALSPKGAKGLMQLIDATAKECADDIGIRTYDVWRINDNTRLGTQYIWKMLNRFGLNLELAIKAYNCGPTCVENVEAGLWKSGYPEETRDYVIQVLTYKRMYENLGL